MSMADTSTREVSPCKDCTDRHESCWGKCEKYKECKIKFEEVKKLKKEYLNLHVSKYKKLRRRIC